jgi:hypothetical protein
MSLIVETGAIVAGAESYISVADASTYHGNRGNAAWGALASDALREQALRKATDYMTQIYRARWKGYRKDGTQVLDWPRSFVYLEPFVHGIVGTYPYLVADTIVPEEAKRACAELALRAAAGDLLGDLGQGVTREKVGPLETEYDKNTPQTVRYVAVDALLAPYLKGGANTVQVVRA